jgi:hypothetical protein
MSDSQVSAPIRIADHDAKWDTPGHLRPWTSWNKALDLEMSFYRQCPLEHGYARFICETFLDGDWTPIPERTDTIPATQNGMGILSYLKFQALRAPVDWGCLPTACAMGDYLVNEALTPASGVYPRFARSTGRRAMFPQPADAGSQSDRPYEIEPDKGGIAGYALSQLFEVTATARYGEAALHHARVLAAQQQTGAADRSPWPFRVDFRNGEARGDISGNMSYILRLYDDLLARGHGEFAGPRQALFEWIKRYQIPSARGDGALFAQFFEDHDTPTNRSAWAPLNLARYLLEGRARLDPDWCADAGVLVEFVRATFTHQEYGIMVCQEQDEDPNAWGGINSSYGAVLAMYAKAVGSAALAEEARQALNLTLYSIGMSGCPRDLHLHPTAGGWQEDAHTDVIHNYVDAIRAFPEWGDAE